MACVYVCVWVWICVCVSLCVLVIVCLHNTLERVGVIKPCIAKGTRTAFQAKSCPASGHHSGLYTFILSLASKCKSSFCIFSYIPNLTENKLPWVLREESYFPFLEQHPSIFLFQRKRASTAKMVSIHMPQAYQVVCLLITVPCSHKIFSFYYFLIFRSWVALILKYISV